jgi:phosphofructokinase-like protein
MRIGILTGGGDCPGLNAAIRAIVRKSSALGHDTVGIRDGWRGAVDDVVVPLGVEQVRGILPRGGTILGTAGLPPAMVRDNLATIMSMLERRQVDALIAIGGEGTIAGAELLAQAGVPVIGVPKTIDNDLEGTDVTFGFDTAVNVATEAIDRLHTTAESHHRILVVEVMGRNAGWIALQSGVAGGASGILIPERPFHLDDASAWVESRFASSYAPVLVVSERAVPDDAALMAEHAVSDEFGSTYIPDVGHWLAHKLQETTGRDARTTVLGHIQRGGTPTAFDRQLATRFGLVAVDAAVAGRWGSMVALRGTEIVQVPLAEAVGVLKTVPAHRYDEVAVLFG